MAFIYLEQCLQLLLLCYFLGEGAGLICFFALDVFILFFLNVWWRFKDGG
jgi:hypothetical protein